MPNRDEFMQTIKELASEDPAKKQAAQDTLKQMGDEAIPYLNRAKGNKSQYPYVEVFRILGIIGDDLDGNSKKNLVDTMTLMAKSRSKLTPEEARQIAREALERWGEEVPPLPEREVRHCHVCNRPDAEVTIRICFLPDCHKPVCEEHAAIIEGGFGTWFCSEEHMKQAKKNPSILM